MTRYILAICMVFLFSESHSQRLSEKAEVTVLTIGPTQQELYSAFGHSGFRVFDPVNGINSFYNYGVFNFNQPNFYINFTRGKLLYKLGVDDYDLYKQYYIRENRSITEQYLNLDQNQKQAVFDFLQENSKPENADYYYNYAFDNCATKIRDVLNESLDHKITYDFAYAKDGYTYRQLMDLYLEQQPWGDLGIDICLGSQIDVKADGNGYMFLPDYVLAAFDKAVIKENGTSKPLVKKTEKLFKGNGKEGFSFPVSPFTLFVVVFFFIGLMTHRSIKYGVRNKWLDILLYGITGILGVLLLLLWFGTDHLSAYNFNLIWAMPLNLVVLFFMFKEGKSPLWKFYYLGYGLLMLMFIVFRELLPQQLHLALVPFVLGLAIRSFYLYFDMRRKERGDRYIL
ncbi:DUF4105 domain-containing protein [Reichenbachiella sp. MALMAid0571]|uniref:lipoprotein N-acyltransferase Lnb domain-containing protein n=1 Tax=Reichenbachiella sp. MALMAid0571 TaxID=3143939 RepID=UPI0032DEC757